MRILKLGKGDLPEARYTLNSKAPEDHFVRLARNLQARCLSRPDPIDSPKPETFHYPHNRC